MIKEGTFREDLFYRLSVIPIDIPPLRERKEDIDLFMDHFLRKYNTYMNRRLKGFSQEVRDLYMNYEWPGNVRELENAIEYSTNMAFGEIIGLDDVPVRLKKAEETLPKTSESTLTLAEQVKDFEREVILKKFKKHSGGGDAKEAVAKELGLSRATLYRKLAELDINKKLL